MSIQDWTDIVDVRSYKQISHKILNSEDIITNVEGFVEMINRCHFKEYCKRLERNINLPFNFL